VRSAELYSAEFTEADHKLYVFSAKGARLISSLRAKPPGKMCFEKQAPKTQINYGAVNPTYEEMNRAFSAVDPF
jgi:hypothetical protein